MWLGLAVCWLAPARLTCAVDGVREDHAPSPASLGGGKVPDAERRLQAPSTRHGSPARCNSKERGLPVRGVLYVPHLVGEPFPNPETDPIDYYTNIYSGMHQRDLPLIGGHVGADTLSLRPWTTESPDGQRDGFFEEMAAAGICKVLGGRGGVGSGRLRFEMGGRAGAPRSQQRERRSESCAEMGAQGSHSKEDRWHRRHVLQANRRLASRSAAPARDP